MITDYHFTLPDYYYQIPDSVNSFSQINNTEQQDTSNSIMFGAQPQTIMDAESADTISDVINVPQTLLTITYIPKKVEKKDTLKYFTEYLNQLTYLKFDNNSLPLLKENFVLKQDISTKYKSLITSRKKLEKQKKVKNNLIKAESKKEKSPNNFHKTIVPEKTIEGTKDNYNFKPTGWILGIIIISIFIFAWIKLFFNKNYRTIIKSGYNYNYSVKLFKEANSGSKRVSSILNLIFILNTSVFIYLFTGYLNIKLPITDFTLIGFLILSIAIMYSIKYLVIKTIGFVFSSDSIASEYLSNIWLFNKLLGISLFPIIITLPYINPSIKTPLAYIGLTIIFIFFIIRIIRSFQIVFKIKLSIIYWILYLCTLEILPVLVLSKIVNIY